MNTEPTPIKTGPKRLGDLFVESGMLSAADLAKGLEYGKKSGMALGKVLGMLRLVADPDLRAVLHVQNLMKFECMPGALAVRALKHMKQTGSTIDQACRQVGWMSDRFKTGVPARLQELREKLGQREERLGPDHTDHADILLDLAQFYEDEEMWAHAEGHCLQAIEKLERNLGSGNMKVADALAVMGNLLFMQDRFEEAQAYYQRSHDLKYQILGAETLEVAKALYNLSEVYEVQKKFSEAEKLYLQSIAVREKYLDIDDPAVLDTIRRLAFVCSRRGRSSDQALVGQLLVDSGIVEEENLPRALEYSRTKNLPLFRALIELKMVDESSLRPVLHAQVLIKSNLLPAPLATRILRLGEKKKISIEDAMALAGWTVKASRSHNITELLTTHDALITAENTQAADSMDIATLCLQLADLYETYERYAEAEPLYRRSLGIIEKYGDDHPRLLEVLDKIGLMSVKQSKFEQAETIYRRVLQLRINLHGEEDGAVAASYLHLGRMYLGKGDPHNAISCLQHSLPIAEKTYGAEHSHVGEIIEDLAVSYYETGDYAKAEPLFWRAFKIKREYLEPQSFEITSMLTKLADLYNKQGQYNMADSVLAMFADQQKSVIL